MNKTITVFKSIDSNSHHEYYDLTTVLDRIKRGVNKKLIDQIRAEPNKGKRDQLKKRLLWICFSGKFSVRNNASLIQHSGFICLDFDGIEARNMQSWRKKIESDKHTLSCFTSPSGNGLKVIWQIPECKSNDEHNQRFDSIAEYWKDCRYFDYNVKGWSRVCFESYDPNIYINPDAELFNGISIPVSPARVPTPAAPAKTATKKTEITDTERIFNNLVTWFERTSNLRKGNRNAGAFMFASAVADYLTESEAEPMLTNYIMSNVEQDPSDQFPASECQTCVTQAFRNNPVPTKKFEISGCEQEPNSVDYLTQPEAESIPSSVSTSADTQKKTIFWEYSKKGSLMIDYFALKLFLESEGFYKYRFNPEDISFIRVQENIVNHITVDYIRDFVLNYLKRHEERQAYNLFASDSKFKKEYLALLDETKPEFVRDTKDCSWIFYRNKAVQVTATDIIPVEYIDLDGFIWASQKLDRDFEIMDSSESDFFKFLWNVSEKKKERFQSLCSGIGYQLHRYKSPSKTAALILNDEVLEDEPQGGTGKTLIFVAISKIRVTVFIDGKNFNSQKSFVWQRVNPDTNNVVVDDIPKSFRFENIFSIITTGWPIEKKNKGEIFLSPEDSPKIGIPTNNVLKGSSASHERRKYEIEIHPHYSEDYQPIDEFGRDFWTSEWSHNDWAMFDNLMLNCIKLYLERGFIKPNYVNLVVKKFISDTSPEFADWANENLQNNKRYNRNEMYNKFMENNPGTYCKNASMFYKWMRAFGAYKNWESKDCGHGKQFIEFGVDESPVVVGDMPF